MSKRSLQDLSFQECISLIEEETKGGRGFKSDRGKFLCPLHNEKTPSFTLNEDQNGVWFYCFGCQKGGNMLTFYKNLGYSYAEACQKLGINGDERWVKEDSRLNLIEKVKYLIIQRYNDLASYGFTLEIKDIFVYQAPNKNFKTYYKCIFRNLKEKQPRFCFFNDAGILEFTAPKKQMPYNYLDAIEWKKNKQKKQEHRKIIITEGEKDVETIKNTLQNYYTAKEEQYIPISFKGLSKEMTEHYIKDLFENKNEDEKISIYFIGDNDASGREYKELIFNFCFPYINKFYLVELPLIYRLGFGADVSDWLDYMARVEKVSLLDIRNIFHNTIKSHHWDYKKSKCWAVLDEKDKPISCWQNIASFFESKKCILRYEIVSGKVHRNLGYLLNIEDKTNASHGICYNSLKSELYFYGLHIKRTNEIHEHIETFLKKRRFNEMLDIIATKPINQDFVKCSFSTTERYNFGHYYLAPLLHWLLNNIEFQSENSLEIEFQQIMIFKALLACPYMLRNEGNRRLRGDLRFISGNQKGKSTFCRELFGATLTDYTWFTQCTLLDVSNRDSKKNALIAPCIILDEGNLVGGRNTATKEVRAFYDESVFSFIDKFEKNRTEIVRKSIIVSSGNSRQNSYDINGERRLWQIEINALPYLSHLKKNIYCKTEEQQAFWKKYNIHSGNPSAFFYHDGEEYFQFPLIEFWREMNHLYEYYEKSIETTIEFSSDQLKFYKELWMQGKYALFDIQFAIQEIHGDNWSKANLIKIPNGHFYLMLEHSGFLNKVDYRIIVKGYRDIASSRNRNDINTEASVYTTVKNKKRTIAGKIVPPFERFVGDRLVTYFEGKNKPLDFNPYQYCEGFDDSVKESIEIKQCIAEVEKYFEEDGFPKKNVGYEI